MARFSVLLVVFLAFYVTVGRQLVPLAGRYKSTLETQLSLRFGTEISIGSLSGGWSRFSPVMSLDNMQIFIPAQDTASEITSHIIRHFSIQLDVPRSLLQWRWVIARIDIDELRLELIESQDGVWSLAGFSDGGLDYTDQIFDFLLNTSTLQLQKANISLRRSNGSRININNGFVQFRNYGTTHQMLLLVDLEEPGDPVHFHVEIEGDPRGEYTGSSYLNFNQVDLSQLITTFDQEIFQFSQLSGSAQVWVYFDGNGIQEVHANLNAFNAEGEFSDSAETMFVTDGSGFLTALQTEPGQWSVWLQEIEFDWQNRPWQSGNYFLRLDNSGEHPALDLAVNKVELGMVKDMLLASGFLPDGARQLMEELSPDGFLNNLHFITNLSGNYPNSFKFAANLEEISVAAWGDAPAGWGINGYVEADQISGFAELDSSDFKIYLPEIFNDSWQYKRANGRVHWVVTDEILRVYSSVLHIRNDDINARVQFDLTNSTSQEGDFNSELTILVGLIGFDASQKSSYLPTLQSVAGTMSWLETAILSGHIENSGFIFRGTTLNGFPTAARTVQTFYNVENASVKFLDDWPQLDALSGLVKVDNNDIDLWISSAEISAIRLNPAIASIRPDDSTLGAWLQIDGTSDTTTELALEFLRNTPAKDTIGDYIDNWKASGVVDLDLSFRIPLNLEAEEPLIQISVLSDNSDLLIPDYGLHFETISGRVNYSSEDGLMADDLSARLFEFPITVGIEAFSNPIPGTRFYSAGRASKSALQNWSKQTDFVKNLLGFIEGSIDYRADLRIFSSDSVEEVLSSLTLDSDLLGVSIDLPQPFTKDSNQSQNLHLTVDFTPEGEIMTSRYGDDFYAQLIFSGDQIKTGVINFGPLNRDFVIRQSNNREAGLVITGELDYFNYEAWSEITEAFAEPESATRGGTTLEDNIRLADVHIQQLDVVGLELFNINTQVTRNAEAWNVFLENELLRGRFVFPDASEEPYLINLDYLRLADPEGSDADLKEELEEEIHEVDMFAEIDPLALPDMNFYTAEFLLGDKNLGDWEFELRVNATGASISNFRVNMEDASISDETAENGAVLEWSYLDGVHSTTFRGLFQAGNLDQVMQSWGYDAFLESENAQFLGDIRWQGSPAAFSIAGISGEVNVDISDGRFVDIDPGAARLFGAFNFDSVVRRLQLDFSDLYERGFAYDTIKGKLDFNQGIVNTDGEFIIEGLSSKITLDGEIDIVNETIKADMLVNVPLIQNISVLAGILAAWPLAVSTYVASKIFEDQVEDFTTVVYQLEGPWEALEAGFEPPQETQPENPVEETAP